MAPTSTKSESFDVVIIRSGCAGMTAALAAAVEGLKMIVLKKSNLVGETSAMSGADMWVPGNHLAAAQGIKDSPAEAWSYIKHSLRADSSHRFHAHWQALCENAAPMLRMVMEDSPLVFELTPAPDPIDVPGVKKYGRNLSPKVLRKSVAGRFGKLIRRSTLPHLFSFREMYSPNPWSRPFYTLYKLGPQLLWRWTTNSRGQGTALIAGLIAGLIAKRGEIRTNQSVASLLTCQGKVTGVQLSDGSEILARRGVLLATGGFEWDKNRYTTYFPGPADWLCTPDSNTGDDKLYLRAKHDRSEICT